MSNLQIHSNSVVENKESCSDHHDEGFFDIGAYYNQYADYLETALKSDIQPEQIVPGGRSLGVALAFPNTSFCGDPGDTTATIERWAITEDSIVRISKTASWHGFGPMTRKLSKQVMNRRSIIPGSKKRRTKAIADAIMAVDRNRLSVDEFLIPEKEITDSVIYEMRFAADALFSQSLLRPISQTRIDSNLVYLPNDIQLRTQALNNAKRRLALDAAHEEVSHKLRGNSMQGTFENQVINRALQFHTARAKYERTVEPRKDEIEKECQHIIHEQLNELIVATDSLKRAVYAIRSGQAIMPTKPQNTVPRYETVLSQSGKGSKSLKLDNGAEITLSIN